MSSSVLDIKPATATRVRVSHDTLWVELSDGRTIAVPVAWYPRRSYATAKQRNSWRLIARGRGIHWPDLDEDISVDNLLSGNPSGESQRSFKKWLIQRARKRRPRPGNHRAAHAAVHRR